MAEKSDSKNNVVIQCQVCRFHDGFEREIVNLKKDQDDLGDEMVRIWKTFGEIDKSKVSNKMFMAFVSVSVLVLLSLFGLLYHSQTSIVNKVSTLNTSVAVLDQKTTDVNKVLNYFKEKEENGH